MIVNMEANLPNGQTAVGKSELTQTAAGYDEIMTGFQTGQDSWVKQ